MAFTRQTAIKCQIKDLLEGIPEKTEEASMVKTAYGDISRANIIGVIVDKTQNGYLLDDGTGRISIRSFEPIVNNVDVGDLVNVIARPREYNEQIYLVHEIIKKLDNPKWVEFRKIELEKRKKIFEVSPKEALHELEKKQETIPKQEEEESELIESEETDTEKIIQFIKDKDTGKGVMISEIEKTKIKNVDKILDSLTAEGSIFEIKPGVVKVLE